MAKTVKRPTTPETRAIRINRINRKQDREAQILRAMQESGDE